MRKILFFAVATMAFVACHRLETNADVSLQKTTPLNAAPSQDSEKTKTVARSAHYNYYFLESTAQQLKGNYAAAFDLLRRAREFCPDAPEVYYHLAGYYIDMDQDSMAQACFEKAVALNPTNDMYVEKLGQMYISQRNYADATEIYERLYDSHRGRYDVLQILLQLYAMENNYEQMLHTLDRMETIEGSTEQISFSKMQIYEQQGKHEKARAELQALAEKNPNNPNYQVMYGNWLLQNGNADEALKQYRRVLKTDPDNTLAQMSMLDYYREKQMTEAADNQLIQLLLSRHTPDDEKVALMRQYILTEEKAGVDSTKILGIFDRVLALPQPSADMTMLKSAYQSLKKMPQEEIEQTLRDALAIEPDHVGARVQLVQDLWNRKDYDEVIALCRPAQEYNPDEMAFYYFQGLAHFQKDEQDEALDVFRKGVSQIKEDSNPDIVSDFYAIMGDILHQKDRDEEAFASYDSCLHWKDDNIGALNNYAYYLSIRKYTKAEDQRAALDKAEQMSRKTIQAEPANSTYLDTYAWILFLQGRYPEAKNYIEQAIANSDDLSGVVKEHAGDIYAVNGDISRAMEFWQQAADGGSDSPTLHKKIAQKRYIEE